MSQHHLPSASPPLPCVSPGASQAQPVNGALPSMPSPTVQNFNIAPQPGPNSQPGGSEGAVFANGLPQTFAARKSLYLKKKIYTASSIIIIIIVFILSLQYDLLIFYSITIFISITVLWVLLLLTFCLHFHPPWPTVALPLTTSAYFPLIWLYCSHSSAFYLPFPYSSIGWFKEIHMNIENSLLWANWMATYLVCEERDNLSKTDRGSVS